MRKIKQNTGILGTGSFGFVINTVTRDIDNAVDYVTKISENNYENMIEAELEFDIGKNLLQLDPESKWFLPPLMLFTSKFDEIKNEKIKNNIQKLKLIDTSKELINIVMKRGYDLEEVLKTMTEVDIINFLKHLLKAIKLLVDNEILLLDIKHQNILFIPEGKKHSHPVFIDFSSSFVITDIINFFSFINGFANIGSFYEPWPLELYLLLGKKYKQKLKKSKATTSKFIFYWEGFLYMMEKNKDKLGINKNHSFEEIFNRDKIYSYVNNLIDEDLPLLYSKMMVYSLGKVMKFMLRNFIIENDDLYDDITKIVSSMLNCNVIHRPDHHTVLKDIGILHEKYTLNDNTLIKLPHKFRKQSNLGGFIKKYLRNA